MCADPKRGGGRGQTPRVVLDLHARPLPEGGGGSPTSPPASGAPTAPTPEAQA
eukprot:SAG22_NODE_8273_length_663_cov_0.978910_2_plen_52_part_01